MSDNTKEVVLEVLGCVFILALAWLLFIKH